MKKMFSFIGVKNFLIHKYFKNVFQRVLKRDNCYFYKIYFNEKILFLVDFI